MKWFISHNEEALGPFKTEDVKSAIESGNFKPEWLIWGRLLKNRWVTIADWQEQLPNILDMQVHMFQQDLQLWHYAMGGKSYGPMTRDQMVTVLHPIEDKSKVMVWTKGMSKWAPLFEFHDLMQDMGVNQRKHPRAGILGTIVISTPDGNSMFGQLQSISAGGIGVKGLVGLSPGTTVDVDLRSDSLTMPVKAKAEVLYVAKNYAGFRFSSIHMEAQSAIIDYIRGITATPNAA